jgi:hypothetical protein
MSTSSDPFQHQQIEKRFIDHVERLLADERLRVDTLRGRRVVNASQAKIVRGDDSVDIKRTMAAMGKFDRDLQKQLPMLRSIDVDLWQKKWWFFSQTIGKVRVRSLSPIERLVSGQAAPPVGRAEIDQIIATEASATDRSPATIVLLSTSGFTAEAREMTSRVTAGNLILVEPNDAGGVTVTANPAASDLKELLNPEAEADKRDRVRDAIAAQHMDLSGSGIAADRIAAKTLLPLQIVESELRSYAKEQTGLAAKKLDGRLVLFRESSATADRVSAGAGGLDMPMIDKLRSLFARKGETEKKIAFLAERRAALGQQRDRAYEEISNLESKDAELREQFKSATAELAKRRVTSQLLQLRKDIERRQQLLTVLNQQVNVVSTHLHNLELVQQGEVAKLPDSEEMASDAAAAEEMLATLQESSEMAESVGGVVGTGMSGEEQALYEELLRETGAPAESVKEPAKGQGIAGATQTPAGQRIIPPINPAPERDKERKQRGEPEAG